MAVCVRLPGIRLATIYATSTTKKKTTTTTTKTTMLSSSPSSPFSSFDAHSLEHENSKLRKPRIEGLLRIRNPRVIRSNETQPHRRNFTGLRNSFLTKISTDILSSFSDFYSYDRPTAQRPSSPYDERHRKAEKSWERPVVPRIR